MSTLKVNAIRQTTATSDAVTLASDGTCTVKATNKSNRNLIINGAMQVAQRGTSSTTAGFGSLDRFQGVSGGGEEACTHSQHALTSSDTGPWAEGFRYSFHFQNGNQTGGAGSNDYAYIGYGVEAQDLAQSGWDYTSASSYITLSFWVKCSVAGLQYGFMQTPDGTGQGFSFSLGNLSANTWTKVTVKIPGNSNITINNDTGPGLWIHTGPFWGTDYTDSGNTLNTWAAYSSSSRTPDFPSTWWTTNDATFEITGVQLEVGDVATDFEHRSYEEELQKCYRYCQRYDTGGDTYRFVCQGNVDNDGNNLSMMLPFITPFRSKPTSMTTTGTAGDYAVRRDTSKDCTSVPTFGSTSPFTTQITFVSSSHGWTTGQSVKAWLKSSGSYLIFSAEL
tara:strand:+ start:2218 stop:3393 length:1176 start_codon:yes stop_codon:yes gene_type:complete